MNEHVKLDDDDLAAYQAQLLDILHAGTSGPDMIDAILVAAGLTRSWGRPKSPQR